MDKCSIAQITPKGFINKLHCIKPLNKFITKIIINMQNWEKKYSALKTKYDRMKKALNVAKDIQLAMLPKNQPNFEGYDIYGRMKANHEVGGDYYDFIQLDKNKLEIIIADASGKGLEAAFITQSIHASIDMAAQLKGENLKDTIKRLNNVIYDHTPPEKFATLIAGELTKNRFKYVNAGHETPIRYSDGEIKGINKNLNSRGTDNLILGIMPNIEYISFGVNLKKGDILFLYSDGIADSLKRNEQAELGRIIKKHHQASSEKISNEIYNFLEKFPQKDDQTAIIIKKE